MAGSDQPGTEKQPLLGGCDKTLIVLTLLPVIAYGILKFLQRSDYKPPFYARVSIDMDVMGKPTHIERITTCKTVVAGNGGDLSSQLNRLFKRKFTEWVAWPRAFGKVLPDGSAIMIRTPYRCYREQYTDDEGRVRIRAAAYADNYLPFMGWSPDGEKVETPEVYFSDSYFREPNARIKNLHVTTELVGGDVTPSQPDRFAWFSGLAHQADYNRVVFKTYAGWIMEESDWRGRSAALDALLDSYDRPAALPQDKVTHQIPGYVMDMLKARTVNYHLLIPEERWRGLTSKLLGIGHPTPSALRNNMLTGVMLDFPVKDDALWLTGPTARGYLRMERARHKPVSNNPKAVTGVALQAIPVILSGTRFDPSGSRYFYDPKTRRLYFVQPESLEGYAENSHPILHQSQH